MVPINFVKYLGSKKIGKSIIFMCQMSETRYIGKIFYRLLFIPFTIYLIYFHVADVNGLPYKFCNS